MYIGELLRERMDMFGFNVEKFSQECMLSPALINNIIDNKTELKNIDNFDLEVISNALFCNPEYFFDKSARDQDVVFSSCNRGIDTQKSCLAKAKLQKFMRDMLFVKDTLN